MILSLLNSDPHRCAFLDHLLLATKWVGVVGCGFGLTTLNELAPGLSPGVSLLAHLESLSSGPHILSTGRILTSGGGGGICSAPASIHSGVFSCRLMLQGKVLESPS